MAPNRTSAALGCLSSALELLPRFLDIPCESFQSRAEGRPDAWLPLRHPPCEPKKRHAQIEARHDVEDLAFPRTFGMPSQNSCEVATEKCDGQCMGWMPAVT